MFACQRDSYARTLSTTVKSCRPVQVDGAERYEVELEDTVLFPEGGGQPDDRGTIGGVPVVRVTRRAASAIHLTESALDEGKPVEVCVDWPRRFDHMQQHSGQHLVTAIADSKWNYKTVSWSLGESKSFLELNCKSFAANQIAELQEMVNKAILDCRPMTPRLLEAGSEELATVRSRGLPDDHVGPVRVVEIQGIDSNMCCGTHVSNLSHLQAIVLLHTEQKRGNTLLYYVAGQRAIALLGRCIDTERQLTRLLSVGPDEHPDFVDKLLKSQRTQTKTIRNQMREIGEFMVERHLRATHPEPVLCVHREDGDMDFMNVLANGLQDKGVLLFVSCGPEKGPGQFLLAGPTDLVGELGSRVAALLDAKGGGRKGRYQGKAKSFSKRTEVCDLLLSRMAASS